MTNREAFATALAVVGATFDRKLTAPAIEGYWIALGDLTEAEFATATKRALTECKFMPAPAELLAFARPPVSLALKAAEAWEAVREAMDRHDYTDSVDFGPLVNAVLHNLGGWQALCDASLPGLVWRRKDFERLFAEFAAKPVDTLNGGHHTGFLRGPVVRIAIDGVLPPLQIESAERHGVLDVVRALADAKSDPERAA